MVNQFNRCWACMELLEEGQTQCSHCHFVNDEYQSNPRCLRPKTFLHDRFYIGKVLGEGGFGITYIGWDSILDMPVAVKEYFPANIASRDCTTALTNNINVFEGKAQKTYQQGLERYIREARALSKFHDLHGIVDIRDFFHENNTAYMIMEYLKGPTLEEHIKAHGKMKPEYVFQIMKPVMRSLEKIHQAGMVHRDISPDNIMLSEGSIKLIDFGAARLTNNDTNKSLTIVLKPGFAPEEQYRSNGKQGPWTDVYAICATIYYMLTGHKPPEAIGRAFEDNLKSFADLGVSISSDREAAIRKGLAPRWQQRYQSIQELCYDLYSDSVWITSQEKAEDEEEEIQNIVRQEKFEEQSRQEVENVIEKSEQVTAKKEKKLSAQVEESNPGEQPSEPDSTAGETVLMEEESAESEGATGETAPIEEEATEPEGAVGETVLMEEESAESEGAVGETVLMEEESAEPEDAVEEKVLMEEESAESEGAVEEKVLMEEPAEPEGAVGETVLMEEESAEPEGAVEEKVLMEEESAEPEGAVGETVLMEEESAEPESAVEEKVLMEEESAEPEGAVEEKVLMEEESAEPDSTAEEKISVKKVSELEAINNVAAHLEKGPDTKPYKPETYKKYNKTIIAAGLIGVLGVAAVMGGVLRHSPKKTEPETKRVEKTEESILPKTTDSKPVETKKAEEVTMPDVRKKTKAAAQEIIKALKVKEAKISYVSSYSDSVKKGSVISQSISAGKQLKQEDTFEIKLTISKGSKPVKVPNLLGKDREKAINLLHKNGLKYRVVAYKHSETYGKGKIMRQKISAGKEVKKGKMIGIVISEGKKLRQETQTSSYTGSQQSTSQNQTRRSSYQTRRKYTSNSAAKKKTTTRKSTTPAKKKNRSNPIGGNSGTRPNPIG